MRNSKGFEKIQKEYSKQITQWCENNHISCISVQDWLFTIKTNEISVNICPVKETWVNNHTGERGRYRDLLEFLNYKFKILKK